MQRQNAYEIKYWENIRVIIAQQLLYIKKTDLLLAIIGSYILQKVINNFISTMSSASPRKFDQESPRKIYNDAHTFSKTLGHRFGDTPLPTSKHKEKYLKDLAYDKTDDVRFTIERAQYQKQLYRRLEDADESNRSSVDKKIVEKDKKIVKNIEELKKKEEKEVQVMSKHLAEVYKKHVELERTAKRNKDDEAVKLRKSLMQFYEKEKERKKDADAKQINVSTCYNDAVTRIDRIHQRNQDYAQEAERQHSLRMARNNGKEKNLLMRSRLQSVENRKKNSIYENNCEILEEKHHRYIQTYCKDLDSADKCFVHKEKEVGKTKERIHKFIKDRVEKWQGLKKRADQEKSVIPTRCQSIMDKTSNSAFRQTVSSFKDSSRNWQNKVRENKSAIYERDQLAKDRIMLTHLDMRLRNNNSYKVQEQIGSMRSKADKVAMEYL